MLRFILTLSALSITLAAGDGSSRYTVYRSEDQGRSWSQSDTGFAGESRINAFSGSGKSIIAGTDVGIFTSMDTGRTWKKSSIVGSLTNTPHRITGVAAVSNTVFAGTSEGVVIFS